ncbi:hypothetical protein F5Y11DRAFT_312366 [Daldinia sp. FL1419]|nr:hypothetical protein F5Y11DRAFT_312366 [Daldinia sp. FL1419]
MAAPIWNLLRLRISKTDVQDFLLVYHGTAEHGNDFTPSDDPICLHVGRGARSWRGHSGLEAQRLNTAREAVEARQGGIDRSLLAAPSVKAGIDPISLVKPRRNATTWYFSNWNSYFFEHSSLLLYSLRILAISLLLINVVLWLGISLSPGTVIAATGRIVTSPITPPGFYVPGIESPSPYSPPHIIVEPIKITESFVLKIKDHAILYGSWAAIVLEFESEVEKTLEELGRTDEVDYADGSGLSTAETLNLLNILRGNIKDSKTSHKSSDNQAMDKWAEMAAWWKLQGGGFDPWNYVQRLISVDNVAAAQNAFMSVVEKRNFRVYNLINQTLCSGTGGKLPWHGVSTHYAKAHANLTLLQRQLSDAQGPLKSKAGQLSSKTAGIVADFLPKLERALTAAGDGSSAAESLHKELDSTCDVFQQAAQLGWRITAQENPLLFDRFMPNNPQEAREIWLTWPPDGKAAYDLSKVMAVVYASHTRY